MPKLLAIALCLLLACSSGASALRPMLSASPGDLAATGTRRLLRAQTTKDKPAFATLPAPLNKLLPSVALKAEFASLDADKDGQLSADEFAVYLKSVLGKQATAEHVKKALAALDLDGDGSISLQELAAWRQGIFDRMDAAASSDRVIQQVFKECDADANGVVSLAELKADVHGVFTDKHVEVLFRTADVNGDGVLCIEEFAALMKAVVKEQADKLVY